MRSKITQLHKTVCGVLITLILETEALITASDIGERSEAAIAALTLSYWLRYW